MAAFVTGSCKALTLMMVLYVYVQIDIIIKRLSILPALHKNGAPEDIIYQRETELIKDCVHHQIHLYL